jgi:ribosomal protein L6P/L9E
MSRIGNKMIPVPSGVKIQIKDDAVEVQGPKGKMHVVVPKGIRFEQKDGTLIAKRDSEDKRALHGLARALVANAVTGVTTGFKKDLDIVGVGYRAEVKGKNVVLALGYSHPIEFPIPEGIADHHREADAHGGNRGGQESGGSGSRESSRAASARSVQAEGRSHYRRALEEEGRQGWREVGSGLGQEENERGSTGSKIIARSASSPHSRAHAQDAGGHARASAALRASLVEAHTRAGSGRPDGIARSFPRVRWTAK